MVTVRSAATERRLVNQPAFCYHLDAPVEVEGLGTVPVSVAYGGMTYAMVDAAALGFAIEPAEARDLCVLGQKIKTAAAAQLTVAHPDAFCVFAAIGPRSVYGTAFAPVAVTALVELRMRFEITAFRTLAQRRWRPPSAPGEIENATRMRR